MSRVPILLRRKAGERPLAFERECLTFTPGMGIREMAVGHGFPVQGKLDGTGTPDAISLSRGSLIGNPTQLVYSNINPYRGTLSLRFVPEWNGDDGVAHILFYSADLNLTLRKASNNNLYFALGGITHVGPSLSAWTSGTAYVLTASWDCLSPLDLTNYVRISVGDSHTYTGTTAPTPTAPATTMNVGWAVPGASYVANGVIELLHIFDRVLFDGTYGDDVGNGDEIAAIVAGADPVTVTKGIGVVIGIPTSCGSALATGTGHAWTWPWENILNDDYRFWQGGLPGTSHEVVFNGLTTRIDCGSGVTLDDIPAGGQITVGIWVRLDVDAANPFIIAKGNGIIGWQIYRQTVNGLSVEVTCATVNASSYLTAASFPADGKYHYLTFFYNDTGDRKIYLAIDGKWVTSYGVQIAGVGAYSSDATLNLILGSRADFAALIQGGIAWCGIWSDDHHVVGTDFIPPRAAPLPGGNLVECWHANEGSGTTVAAQVTTPANDGTIISGAWNSLWKMVGAAGLPLGVELDGVDTRINCGSDATLDDLQDAAFTVDIVARLDGYGEGNQGVLLAKGAYAAAGWFLGLDNTLGLYGNIQCATADGWVRSGTAVIPTDGKLHHYRMTWDDASYANPRLWIDGIEQTNSTQARNGAILTDAGANFMIGDSDASNKSMDGMVAWVAVYDAVESVANFTPPRAAPSTGGNLVECWYIDEGSGTDIAALVSGNNDGTLTNGFWSSIWEVYGTSLIPQGHTFDGAATTINCGSGAILDDIPAGGGDLFVEVWGRWNGAGESSFGGALVTKGGLGAVGWQLTLQDTRGLNAYVHCADTDAWSFGGLDDLPIYDNLLHHFAMHYDDTTKDIRLWIDGVEVDYSTQNTGSGAYVSDAAADLVIGDANAGGFTLNGAMAYLRISDNARQTGTFIPNSPHDPPIVDANTMVQYNFIDGIGTTLADAVGPGDNNGTITPGTGKWLNTPDQAIHNPGARLGISGYEFGSDGVDDGITTKLTTTELTDYVVRGLLNVGGGTPSWPIIRAYDNTGAALIVDYLLPHLADVHDGGANNANLVNSNGSFTQALVGWVVYNITDGSWAAITACVSPTELATSLSNGTDDDWDAGDIYRILPPGRGEQNHGLYHRNPSGTDLNFVFRTPANCISVNISILNARGVGLISAHDFQVLPSLANEGDMENLAGDPAKPPLWSSTSLEAGDTEAEASIIHSGAQSLQYNNGADNLEGVRPTTLAATVGRFYLISYWAYNDGWGVSLWTDAVNQMAQQASDGQISLYQNNPYWSYLATIGRSRVTSPEIWLLGNTSSTNPSYADDYSLIEMTPLSLTVTPASYVNSWEDRGIRIDGRDTADDTVRANSLLSERRGDIRFRFKLRHDDADVAKFGFAQPRFFTLVDGIGTDHFYLRWNAADDLQLSFIISGVPQADTWATASALLPDTWYDARVLYTPARGRLWIDAIERITVEFPTVPHFNFPLSYFVWGNVGAQIDAVFR